MQRTTGNSTVTTTTQAGFTFGLVSVGANAVRCASRKSIAGSKCSETGKPVALVHRLHDADAWRHRALTDMRDADMRNDQARLARAESYQLRTESALPPRLWASWVLSQSLCG